MSDGWLEILKFVGPPAAVAIIFFWQYCRFANRVLDRVDKREQTLLEFVSSVSATSATTTEVCRGLSERIDDNTDVCRNFSEKLEAAIQRGGDSGVTSAD